MTQQYPPDQPPHYGHRQRPRPGPVPPPPKRQPRWPWVVGGFMLLLALIGTVWGNDSGEQTTQNRPGVPSGVNPDTWNAQPHTVSAATAPAAPAQSGPQTTFSSGTYEVGTDIEPGKYKTTGPESGSLAVLLGATEEHQRRPRLDHREREPAGPDDGHDRQVGRRVRDERLHLDEGGVIS
jgi:hypothetical protein